MLAILLRNNASEDSFTLNVGSMAIFAYMLEAKRHPKTRLPLLTWMGHEVFTRADSDMENVSSASDSELRYLNTVAQSYLAPISPTLNALPPIKSGRFIMEWSRSSRQTIAEMHRL